MDRVPRYRSIVATVTFCGLEEKMFYLLNSLVVDLLRYSLTYPLSGGCESHSSAKTAVWLRGAIS